MNNQFWWEGRDLLNDPVQYSISYPCRARTWFQNWGRTPEWNPSPTSGYPCIQTLQRILCTGGVYYVCTLCGAIDFFIVQSKGLYGLCGGPDNFDFLGPNGTRFAHCHFRAQKSLDCQGPKKSWVSGPIPSNGPFIGSCPHQNNFTSRAIWTTGTLIHCP